MVIYLKDLLDPEKLEADVKENLVHKRYNEELNITQYRYNIIPDDPDFWTVERRMSRGLIIDETTKEVLERPLDKFFNYNQKAAPKLDPHTKVTVADKLDGSLGILVQRHAVLASSKSTSTEMSELATALYREKYHGIWTPNSDLTYLFEVITPQNRIVLNYSGVRDLFLLGVVNKATGDYTPGHLFTGDHPFRVPEVIAHDITLMEATKLPSRDNAEGIVVTVLGDKQTLVKVKQEDYITMHRMATGLTPHAIWAVSAIQDLSAFDGGESNKLVKQLVSNVSRGIKTIEEMKDVTPDELWDTVDSVHASLVEQVNKEFARIAVLAESLMEKHGPNNYKDIALEASSNPKDVNLVMPYVRQQFTTVRSTIWSKLELTKQEKLGFLN